MNKKFLIIGAVTLILIVILGWLFIESSKPQPGEKTLQDGRNHVPEGSKVDYKFNPPTSGDHYSSWITKGFYDTPRMDGNLVHSQEHGYIIIWYNCEAKGISLIPTAYAQSTTMTQGSEGSPSASLESLPKTFFDSSCDNLKKQLKEVYQKFGPHKIIIVPRPNMDHKIVLTAWGRMEKLDSVDQNKIKEFIDAFRDGGPEATNEP